VGDLKFEEMTTAEWLSYTGYLFDKYEKEGFSKVYMEHLNDDNISECSSCNKMPFEIIERCTKDEVHSLEELPCWKAALTPKYNGMSDEWKTIEDNYDIEHDGKVDYSPFECKVYPHEVIPSVIIELYECLMRSEKRDWIKQLKQLKTDVGYI